MKYNDVPRLLAEAYGPRTVHGMSIEAMSPHERNVWLERYTELLADAQKRSDTFGVSMYRDEVRKLL